MHIFTFTKENGTWYINFSDSIDNQQPQHNLTLVEGSETMLNLLSNNCEQVTVALDTEPFDNADVLELIQLCQPFLDGGIYYMHRYAGQPIDYKIWLCDVPKYAFGSIPERIYVRRA
jgi:hypothetical protein